MLMIVNYDPRVANAIYQYRRGQIGIGSVIVVFVTVLVGVILAGPFDRQVTLNLVNYTGGALAIGNMLPLFFILLIMAVILAPVAREFARAG